MPNRTLRRCAWAVAAVLWSLGIGADGIAIAAIRQEAPAATSQPCPGDGIAAEGCAPSGEVAEELPPPHLPTTNEQGYRFRLEATLTVDLDAAPTEAPVYALERASWTEQDAIALAARLGIDDNAEDRGGGVFAFTGGGQLFVTPDLVQYLSSRDPGSGSLPEDEVAVSAAREWLRRAELAPPDLGTGRVASRIEESDRLVVLFTPAEPDNVLAAYPSISVSVGPDGEVLEATMRWPTIRRADMYRLVDAEAAWFRVEASEVFLDADLDGAGLDPGAEVAGTVEYTEIDLAYTTAGPPSGDQYLAPVFVFSGRLTLEGTEQTYPIKAYVPAIAGSGAPVGQLDAGRA